MEARTAPVSATRRWEARWPASRSRPNVGQRGAIQGPDSKQDEDRVWFHKQHLDFWQCCQESKNIAFPFKADEGGYLK